MDFEGRANKKKPVDVYARDFRGYSVDLSVAVSDRGNVAAFVASKTDKDDADWWVEYEYGDDSFDGEDRGLVRTFAWSCEGGRYVRLGTDMLGWREFGGFGQSDLSSDERTLAVGANQPPPGKTGYVDVYALEGDGRLRGAESRISRTPWPTPGGKFGCPRTAALS